jgi:transcriptional regulator with XRE-family HTH domain
MQTVLRHVARLIGAGAIVFSATFAGVPTVAGFDGSSTSEPSDSTETEADSGRARASQVSHAPWAGEFATALDASDDPATAEPESGDAAVEPELAAETATPDADPAEVATEDDPAGSTDDGVIEPDVPPSATANDTELPTDPPPTTEAAPAAPTQEIAIATPQAAAPSESPRPPADEPTAIAPLIELGSAPLEPRAHETAEDGPARLDPARPPAGAPPSTQASASAQAEDEPAPATDSEAKGCSGDDNAAAGSISGHHQSDRIEFLFRRDTSDSELTAEAAISGAGIALAGPRVSSAVAVAMDFAKLSGGWAGPLVFNVWLRRQMRERRLSQRQLGMLSGVSHSTISRLLSNRRSPTLETATKLVHALRLDWTDEQVATYFDLLPEQTLFPTQRVESALRGDGGLEDPDVRAVMDHYLVLRAKRRREREGGAAEPQRTASDRQRLDQPASGP